VTRAQYQSLVGQLERTRLAEEADATGVVKFEVIDPPTAAFSPVSPKRKYLVLGVLFAGFAAAFGVAFLLHQWKPVFSNVRQLTELSGLPVLGSVSMTWRERYKSKDRRVLFSYAGQGAALVLVAFVIVVTADELTRFVQ
jgi:hypothetical protein